jgi:hypothetical protein
MAKIPRYQGNLQAFASGATGQERVVFGQPSSAPTQSDDLTDNINAAFVRGWGTVPLGDKPPREWFNSATWAATQLSAYQHQVGVPEWDDEQEYHKGSIVNRDGGLMFSGINDNVGNDPDAAGSNWLPVAGYVTPQMFGAVGDGVTDDSTALGAVITSGYPVDWGSSVYAVDGGLTATITHAVKWRSQGAIVRNVSATPTQVTLEILSDGQDHRISGDFTVDANDNSYIALRLENTSSDIGSIVAEDLKCINAFRSGTDFNGGSGLNIKGYYERIHLTRPTIKNCHLGTGAGIAGIVGISGLLIEPKSTTPFEAALKVHIEDPRVEDVYSDDPAYKIDQDGFNIRTAGDDVTRDLPWETDVNIEGGTFKNCWGRSIKVQSENGNVQGSQFIRTSGNEHNGSEIDFQVGAGNVSNIKCIYESDSPNFVVTMSGARRSGKLVPYGSVSGVKVSIAPSLALESVVNCANREFTQQSWAVRDVVVRGAVGYIVRLTGGSGSSNVLMLSDVTVDTLNEYLVWSGINSFSEDARVYINRVTHFGAPVPIFRAQSTTSPLTSSDEVFGFTDDPNLKQEIGVTGDFGPIKRVNSIAPVGARESGLIKPVSLKVGGNDSAEFPLLGFNTTTGMVIISTSSNQEGKGIFAYDSGGVIQIAGEATQFSTGTTSEPGSGNFRLWYENGVLNIANRSGTERMFTCLMIA